MKCAEKSLFYNIFSVGILRPIGIERVMNPYPQFHFPWILLPVVNHSLEADNQYIRRSILA